MNLAQASVKLFLAKIFSTAIGFIGIAYFARELGASELGIFFLFQALLGILAIPADFGLRGAVEKRISEGSHQEEFLASAVVLKLIPLGVILLGITLFRPYINRYLGADVAMFLALSLLIQETAQLSIAVLKGELRVGETAILAASRRIIWVVGGVLFINYGYGADGLIYALIAGITLQSVWGWNKLTLSLGRPSAEYIQSLIDYSKYNVISSIGGYFYSWMDVAIIGLFLTQAEVGVYEIAWRVSAVTILFSQSVSSAIFPQVSDWSADGAQERIENLITIAMTPSLFFVIPAFFGTAILSEEILDLVFGEEYAIAALVLVILMFDKIFQAIQVIVARSLQAIDQPDLAARATVISIISNLVLNLILIWKFGIIGAAVATVTSSLINDFLHLFYLRRFVQVSFPSREITECIIASVMMASALILLESFYGVNSLFELLLFVTLGAAIYCLLAYLFPNLRPRMVDILKRREMVRS